MKFEAVTKLRAALKAGEPAYGMWITTEAVAITELAVAAGLACVPTQNHRSI